MSENIYLVAARFHRTEVTYEFHLEKQQKINGVYLQNTKTNELVSIKKVSHLDQELHVKFNMVLGPNEEGVLGTGIWRFIFLTDEIDYEPEKLPLSALISSENQEESADYYKKLKSKKKLLPELAKKTDAGYKVITSSRKKHIEFEGTPYIRIHSMSKLFYKNKTNFYDVNILGHVGNNEVLLSIINKAPEPPKTWSMKQKEKINKTLSKIKNKTKKVLGIFGLVTGKVTQKVGKYTAKLNDPMYTGIYKWSKRLFKEKQNRILFTSDSRAEIGGNLEFIHNRMLERNLDKDLDIRMIFKESIRTKRSFKDKILFPYYLATSKTILLDDYHPMLYKVDFSENQKVVQLWHASGPFKTVGFSRLGKPGGPALMSNTHRNYTHAIVSSDYAVQFYAEAFSMPEAHVIPTGIPRVDPFFSESYKHEIVEKLHKEIPAIAKAEKVILFSPTFRGVGPSNAYYPYDKKINFDEMAEYARRNNAIFLIKLHPFVIKNIVIPRGYEDVLIDVFDYREINDLLFVTDLLITDYSSVVFEYSIFEKPMIFYAYDLEEYTASRDFYVKFEEFVPGKIVKTFDDLMYSIETNDFEQEKIKDFKNLYFKYQDANSTDRVIDQIILEKDVSDKYVLNGTPS